MEQPAQRIAPGVEADGLGRERAGQERVLHAAGIRVDRDLEAAERRGGGDLRRLADEGGQEVRLARESPRSLLGGQLDRGAQPLVEQLGLDEEGGGGRETGRDAGRARGQRLVVALTRALRRQREPQDLAREVELDPEPGTPHLARDAMGLRPAGCVSRCWVHGISYEEGRPHVRRPL